MTDTRKRNHPTFNNTPEHMTALSIWGPYALRRSVNIVFLLLARQNKQASFALARASVPAHVEMMGFLAESDNPTVGAPKKIRSAQQSWVIAVDIAGALSK